MRPGLEGHLVPQPICGHRSSSLFRSPVGTWLDSQHARTSKKQPKANRLQHIEDHAPRPSLVSLWSLSTFNPSTFITKYISSRRPSPPQTCRYNTSSSCLPYLHVLRNSLATTITRQRRKRHVSSPEPPRAIAVFVPFDIIHLVSHCDSRGRHTCQLGITYSL